MDLDHLRTFGAILDHGSFSRAAQALGVTQSTVSFQVKALERASGSRLLDRRGGGAVQPTAAGRLLRRYALRMLALHDEAVSRLRADEAGAAGHVSIAASTIPAESLLPPILGHFRKTHPGVSVTIDVSDSRRAVAALLAQECDVALTGARLPDRRVVYTPFARDEVVLVARRDFRPRRLTPADLARVPLVLREEGSGTGQAVAALLARARAGRASGGIVRTGSSEAVKRCVLAAVGLGFLSRHAIADEIRDGRLAVVRLPGTPVDRRFYVARLRGATTPGPARALIALLDESYQKIR